MKKELDKVQVQNHKNISDKGTHANSQSQHYTQWGWPLPEIWNLTRCPLSHGRVSPLGSLHQCGRTLRSCVSVRSPLSEWALCVPAQASTSLGFVELRRVDKHKLPPVTAPSLDAAGRRPRKLVLASEFWTASLQWNRLCCLTNAHLSRAVFISKLCLPQTKPKQVAEYPRAPTSSPRSRNSNTHYQIFSKM